MTLSRHISPEARWQLLVEAVALAVLACVATRCFPEGTDALKVTAAMAVAYAVPRAYYTHRSDATPAGRTVIVILGLILIACAVSYMWYWSLPEGCSLEYPFLDSDDGKYYRWALYYYDGRVPQPHKMEFVGFPAMMLLLWKIFGVSVVWPVAMNMMATMFSVIIVGRTAVRLMHGKVKASDQYVATLTMLLCCTLFFFLTQGIIVLKEALVYVAMSMVAYVLAGIKPGVERASQSLREKDFAIFSIACLIIAMTRTTFMYFVFFAIVVMSLAQWRTYWRATAGLMVIALIFFFIGNQFAYYSFNVHMNIATGHNMQYALSIGIPQQPYNHLVGDYFSHPIWLRALLTPLTTAIQFIIPFPWLLGDLEILPHTLQRFQWTWYAIGGLVVYYALFMGWRRGKGLGWWPVWVIASDIIVAFITGGSVSRYVLPLQVLMVPMAVYVLLKIREEDRWRKSFAIFAVVFSVILVATIVICYYVQVSYLIQLEDFYKIVAASRI